MGRAQKYFYINLKLFFHDLNTWGMYYEYTSTTKQVLTFVKTALTSTIFNTKLR